MNNLVTNSFKVILEMPSKERNLLLCKLLTKEYLNTIMPDEIVQLSIIQAIRKENGEMDKVLKNWANNPDLDPRLQK